MNLLNARRNVSVDMSDTSSRWTARIIAQVKSAMYVFSTLSFVVFTNKGLQIELSDVSPLVLLLSQMFCTLHCHWGVTAKVFFLNR